MSIPVTVASPKPVFDFDQRLYGSRSGLRPAHGRASCRRLVGRALLRDPDGRNCRTRFHCTDACRPPTHTPEAPWRLDRPIRHALCHSTGRRGTVKFRSVTTQRPTSRGISE